MGPRAVSEQDAVRAITLRNEGRSYGYIAGILGRSKSVVERVIKRNENYGLTTRRPGQGRKRMTTAREDRRIRLAALKDPFITSQAVADEHTRATHQPISARTIRNRLKEAGIKAYRPWKVMPLTAAHRVSRRQFALRHRRWTLRDWRKVCFSDETRISLRGNDDRQRVYRRRGERYVNKNSKTKTPYGSGSIMCWAAIGYNYRSPLVLLPPPGVTALRYKNEILQPYVVPLANRYRPNFCFQHDNARPHTARLCTDYLQQNDVLIMAWPPNSPDVNIIENLFDVLKRRIRNHQPAPRNLEELYQVACQVWDNIDQNEIRQLFKSCPARCQAVISQRGHSTRY